jgi:tetratricopeptide (TPR) repeat protein
MNRFLRRFNSAAILQKQITIYKIRDIKPKEKIVHEEPKTDLYTRNISGRKVIFNLNKLRTLSGGEKIELLRDYLNTKQTKEALYVYNTIIENGFANRLKYHDHHCLFHMCLRDVNEWKQGILQIHHQLQLHRYEPTENYLNEYLICCTKWGNAEASMEALNAIKEAKCQVLISSWDHLLNLYLEKQEQSMWEKGVELWKQLKASVPVCRPSRRTYLHAMALYIKLGDTPEVLNTYYEAEENLSRLAMEHEDKSNCTELESEQWKLNQHTVYAAQVMDHLVDTGKFAEAHDLYSELYPLLISAQSRKLKYGLNLYHILLKMLQRMKLETDEKLNQYWEQMKDLDLEPDHLLYSRKLSLLRNLPDIEETYRLALTSLPLKPGSSKRQAIDSSFLLSMCHNGYIDRCLEVFDEIQLQQTKRPIKLVYFTLIDNLIERKRADDCHRLHKCLLEDFHSDQAVLTSKYASSEWVKSQLI